MYTMQLTNTGGDEAAPDVISFCLSCCPVVNELHRCRGQGASAILPQTTSNAALKPSVLLEAKVGQALHVIEVLLLTKTVCKRDEYPEEVRGQWLGPL